MNQSECNAAGWNPEKIARTVISTVAESLALEADEVGIHALLIDDLGMDSLDFLDIMFSLEKIFQQKIRDEAFDRVLRPKKSTDESPSDRAGAHLTSEEIHQLAPLIPLLAKAAISGEILRKELFSYVTVETLVNMVIRKVLPIVINNKE